VDPVAEEKMYSAKPAVIVVFVVAMALALGAWFYAANLQRRPIQFWGADQAVLILRAPLVEVLTLAPVEGSAVPEKVETFEIDKRRWQVSATQDISQAVGLKNVRSALMHDYSFAWDEKVDGPAIQWRQALRFRDGDRKTTLILAPEQSAAYSVQTGQTRSIAPAIKGLTRFLEDVLDAKE
jgi:hypothetical protein